jgi:hypothetical protein
MPFSFGRVFPHYIEQLADGQWLGSLKPAARWVEMIRKPNLAAARREWSAI